MLAAWTTRPSDSPFAGSASVGVSRATLPLVPACHGRRTRRSSAAISTAWRCERSGGPARASTCGWISWPGGAVATWTGSFTVATRRWARRFRISWAGSGSRSRPRGVVQPLRRARGHRPPGLASRASGAGSSSGLGPVRRRQVGPCSAVGGIGPDAVRLGSGRSRRLRSRRPWGQRCVEERSWAVNREVR